MPVIGQNQNSPEPLRTFKLAYLSRPYVFSHFIAGTEVIALARHNVREGMQDPW
jgi:hypothetical protein